MKKTMTYYIDRKEIHWVTTNYTIEYEDEAELEQLREEFLLDPEHFSEREWKEGFPGITWDEEEYGDYCGILSPEDDDGKPTAIMYIHLDGEYVELETNKPIEVRREEKLNDLGL